LYFTGAKLYKETTSHILIYKEAISRNSPRWLFYTLY